MLSTTYLPFPVPSHPLSWCWLAFCAYLMVLCSPPHIGAQRLSRVEAKRAPSAQARSPWTELNRDASRFRRALAHVRKHQQGSLLHENRETANGTNEL